jgi:hypothetical protein
MKQGGALSPLIFNFASEYAIRRTQGNQEGLKLNATQHLWSCANDINIAGKNIDTIGKNTEASLDASKEVGLEVNPEKTKCVLMSLCRKIGYKHSIKVANRSFEDVAKFMYLGTTLRE